MFPILFRKYVLSLSRVDNDRSAVAVVTGNAAKIFKRMWMFEKNHKTL